MPNTDIKPILSKQAARAVLGELESIVLRLKEYISSDDRLDDVSKRPPGKKRFPIPPLYTFKESGYEPNIYSPTQSMMEKERIEQAYKDGLLTFHKKRALKMIITKSTIGWRS